MDTLPNFQLSDIATFPRPEWYSFPYTDLPVMDSPRARDVAVALAAAMGIRRHVVTLPSGWTLHLLEDRTDGVSRIDATEDLSIR